MRSSELPSRDEVKIAVLGYRIDGYELDDLVQEGYLAILEANRDEGEWGWHHVHKHLRRLKRRKGRRRPKGAASTSGGGHGGLVDDDTLKRTEGDIDALVLMVALRSLCRNDGERWLLDKLAGGITEEQLCNSWRRGRACVAKRVARFRAELWKRLEEID